LVLARNRFRGKSALQAVIDLPFAVSPVVVGVALILLWGSAGLFGFVENNLGFKIIFGFPGIVLASIFVTVPFVIREVEPVLHEIGTDQEEAAATLGSQWWQTFWRVTLPSIRWGLTYGIVLTIARTLGEMTTQTLARARLSSLVAGVRAAVSERADWPETAQLVEEQLRQHLPRPEMLTAEQRLGSSDGYRTHTLHVEPDRSFSIIVLVWRPGQMTRIHDHLTWCVFGVIQGVEHEELFDAGLNLVGESDNHAGDVSGFAPPGDIHRVHNTGDTTAISIHVYGTDVTRVGSSARRYYD
jgi:predicted metal-dependent enzyme (double-stranded beta helix superfamily)